MTSLSDYSTAIATMLLVIVTYFLVKATKQLADINRKMWMAQDRPFLSFYTKPSGNLGHETEQKLYVKNIGKGNACNILFDMYVDNKPEPKGFDVLSVNEEKLVNELVGSEILDIDNLMYEDINKFEYFQDVVIHRH